MTETTIETSGPCARCGETRETFEAGYIHESLKSVILCSNCAGETCKGCGFEIPDGDVNPSFEAYGRTLCSDCYDSGYN